MTIKDMKCIFQPGDMAIKHKAQTISNSTIVSYKPNNYVANLSIPEKHQNKGYEDIFNFFQSHQLHYAMTATPSFMYPEMLMEFWYTCEYDSTRNFITGYVCNGKYTVTVNVNCLRDVLKLPLYETFDPIVDDTTAIKILSRIGYNFATDEENKKSNVPIVRKRMPAVWSYMFANVIRSLGSKVGSYDQPNAMEMQIIHSMIKGKNIDYAKLIFDKLKRQVVKQRRGVNVPYTRFLSLVFENSLGNKYTEVDMVSVPPNVTGSNMFVKPIQPTDRKITKAMRWQIDNPFVLAEVEKDNRDCLSYMAKKKERAMRNTDANTPKKKLKFRFDDTEIRYDETILRGHNSSSQCGIICVQGYKVKQSVAPILEAIFKKHGDIAAKCIFKTALMITSVLESVCEVVRRIQSNEFITEMEDIECQLSDAEAANINVSWLRDHLEAIHKRKQGVKKSSLLLEMKVNTILVKRAAQKDLKERCTEFLAFRERLKKAERCVRVLHLVEKNLNNKILESKAEKDSIVVQPIL